MLYSSSDLKLINSVVYEYTKETVPGEVKSFEGARDGEINLAA